MKAEDTAATSNVGVDFAAMSNEKRRDYIRADRWINYTTGQKAIALLEDLLTYPTRDRMPCLLIYGGTGMGKTKIISKFVRAHAPEHVKGMGFTRMPVLSMQMPSTPDDNEFYNELFRALGGPSIPEGNNRRIRDTCRSLLAECETKMLIIDEIHSMLSGSARASVYSSIRYASWQTTFAFRSFVQALKRRGLHFRAMHSWPSVSTPSNSSPGATVRI